MNDLEGKVALITGGSRGIGRAVSLRLAKAGAHVVAAAKTLENTGKSGTLGGSVQETVRVCEGIGPQGLAIAMDVRDESQIKEGVRKTIERFGRLDIAIHNAGALWWKPIKDTPLSRFDLLHQVNTRGAYALAFHSLPHLIAAGGGHFLTMSPPMTAEGLEGKTGYLISKFGMTMVALGVAEEHRQNRVAGNSLWPETLIESAATVHFEIGNPSQWYKAELLADATYEVVRRDPETCTGRSLLAMQVLRDAGVSDFVPYRCDPEKAPPLLHATWAPRAGGREKAGGALGG